MTEPKSLADIISGIEAASDPIQNIMSLTYEFDECQLVNFVFGRDLLEEARISQKKLLELSKIRPIVIYDAAKTKESRSLPQFLELHPWKSRAFGCHHSKAYCIVTGAKVHLVLGSFNLTQSGLFHNREVLDHFTWGLDDVHSDDSHILGQWINFLSERYISRMHNSEHSALEQLIKTLEARRDKLPASTGEDNCSLVFSGYGENGEKGLNILKTLWSQWFPNESPTGLFVVSPFFDQNPAKSSIAKEFLLAFPSLRAIHICTAEETEPMLCKEHFGPPTADASHALFRVPKKTGEDERQAILAEAATQHISISEDQTLERKLHAKVLLLFNNELGISYAGSANFSRNAWLGRNQELGVARRENDIRTLRKNILKGLFIESENRYAALPASLPQRPDLDDDEAEFTHELFPDFIEHIVLERCPETNNARFVLHKTAEEARLLNSSADYRVTWGSNPLELMLDEHLASQWIEKKQWQRRLVGGRNLAFYHLRMPDSPFWFPFQYSDSLINETEYLLEITSLDWLLCHATNQTDFGSSGLAGDTSDLENTPSYDINSTAPDRETNTVIAMQRYLQQFGDVEDSFQNNIESILKHYKGDEQNAAAQERCVNQIKSAVLSPLEMFFSILRKEYAENSAAKDALPQYAFRLGELLLFARKLSKNPSLPQGILSPLCGNIEEALSTLSAKEQNGDRILRSYLDFVLPRKAQ